MSAVKEQEQQSEPKPNGEASNQNTAIATAPKQPRLPDIAFGQRGVELRTFDDMFRFADMVIKSQLAPKGFENPAAVMVALQMGAELGLNPMASLQNIAVINGKPSVYGDCQLAVVRASGLFDEQAFSERIEGTGDQMKAICTVRRLPNGNPATNEFSIADARRAGLADKTIWKQYPQRMLKFRARSWVLRDNFGDILLGFPCVEEMYGVDHVREVPRDAEVGPRVAGDSEPAATKAAALAQRITGNKLVADQPPVETAIDQPEVAPTAADEGEVIVAAEETLLYPGEKIVPEETATPLNTYEHQKSKVLDLLEAFNELGMKGKALDCIQLEADTRALGKIEQAKLPNVIARLEVEYAKVKGKKK